MVDQISRLRVDIEGEEAARDAKQVADALDKVEKEGEQVTRGMRRTSREMRRMETAARRLGAAIGTYLASAFTLTVTATVAQDNALTSLRSSLQNFNDDTQLTEDRLISFADALQRGSTASQAQIIDIQALLLRYNDLTDEGIIRATGAVLNLSAALNRDFRSTALQLGKALAEPARNLSLLNELSITLTESDRELIKSLDEVGDRARAAGIILDRIQDQFRGAATEARSGLGGALKAVANSFTELFALESGPIVDALQELDNLLNSPQAAETAERISTAIGDFLKYLVENGDQVVRIAGALVGALLPLGPLGRVLAAIAGSTLANVGLEGTEATSERFKQVFRDIWDDLQFEVDLLSDAIWESIFGPEEEALWEQGGMNVGKIGGRAVVKGVAEGIKENKNSVEQAVENELGTLEIVVRGSAIVKDLSFDTFDAPSEFRQRWDEALQAVRDGMEEYVGDWETAQADITDITIDAFRDLEDQFISFVRTGKFQIKDLVDSILEELLRLQYRQRIIGPLNQAINAGLNALTGFVFNQSPPPVSGPSTQISGPTPTGGAPVSSVPEFQQGTPYVPRTGYALVHQGERITPAARNRGMDSNTTVVINEAPPGTSVEQTNAPDGSEIINVVLGAVRQDLRDGPSAAMLRNTYGLRRQGVFR